MGNRKGVISFVPCSLSAGAGDNKRCQALIHSGRDSEPHVCGCPEVHGSDHLPQHAVVCPSSDHFGSVFPLAGTFGQPATFSTVTLTQSLGLI